MDELLEKSFRKGRWYIKNGKESIPFANYIWLKGNPAFGAIPKGYVIHHLDHDPLNDDISNLVLMQKHHHMAHHFKGKIIKPEIKLNAVGLREKRISYFPVTEPKIDEYRKGRYRLRFNEAVNGESRRIDAYRWNGHLVESLDMAEKFKEFIWPNHKHFTPTFTQSNI